MKYKLQTTLAAAAAVLLSNSSPLQASLSFIDGTVSFGGSATVNGSTFLTSTAFTAFQDVTVGAPSGQIGAYAGTSGTAVTLTPFIWNPVNASTPINPLWTFTSGGDTYSFDLSSMVLNYATPEFLSLSGVGTAYITGPGTSYLPTTGDWNFTATSLDQATFTFASTSGVSPVPEASTMFAGVMLLLPFGCSTLRGFKLALRSKNATSTNAQA